MKNKGFTLVELIIVIAILAIIMLIGIPAFATIQERIAVRADKASAAQIGKALTVREIDIGKTSAMPYYSTTDGTGIVKYDEIENVENYVSKGLKPKSMKDGYYFATAIHTDQGKKILVGIGRNDLPISGVYNSPKASGWAWSEGEEITEFLNKYGESGLGGDPTMPENYGVGSEGISLASAIDNGEITINGNIVKIKTGDYVAYSLEGKKNAIELDANLGGIGTFIPENYDGGWQIFGVKDGQVQIISAESVGNLTLTGKSGYANAVLILNNLCKGYENDDLAAPNKARSLGSTRDSQLTISETEVKFLGLTPNPSIPFSDEYYLTDCRDSIGVNKKDAEGDYLFHKESNIVWLASRYLNALSSRSNFDVRILYPDGTPCSIYVFSADSDGSTGTFSPSYGVRPVITLKSGIKLTEEKRNGTKGSPYGITN